jgi:two-component sensor histidine kinase
MLLAMVLWHPDQFASDLNHSHLSLTSRPKVNGPLLATACLGLLWNVGAFVTFVLESLGGKGVYPLLSAASLTALGFLPAVVVHLVLQSSGSNGLNKLSLAISRSAYLLSAIAGGLHFYGAIRDGQAPSLWALRALTFGYIAILAVLIVAARRQPGWKKAVWASALAVFAVSALHLAHHHGDNADSWFRELTGHHASLPLAMAILYEDYRFAFADIFLKRALALLGLVVLTLGIYMIGVAPLIESTNFRGAADVRLVLIVFGFAISTALLYPIVRRSVGWLVDTVILRRADYTKLRVDLINEIGQSETIEDVLNSAAGLLGPALSARETSWSMLQDVAEGDLYDSLNDGASEVGPYLEPASAKRDEIVILQERGSSKSALVFVPTAEPPYFIFGLGRLSGGRRLLSGDISMLESVAMLVARRIDSLRVTHERCEQSIREQEISKLATEAQLSALRAQINPHFLFNALTTIGYLVQTSPDRALDTILRLTALLRGVLRSTAEFVTLHDELELIEAYLDIERARFEERLRVRVDIPTELLGAKIPAFVVQPIVENAIKHGIAPSRKGGDVTITASIERLSEAATLDDTEGVLSIVVRDTGVGASELDIVRGRRRGVGLINVEQRLRSYFGPAASLRIFSNVGNGTTVELRMPLAKIETSRSNVPAQMGDTTTKRRVM